MSQQPPPSWRRPIGVDPALWAYVTSERLAEEEHEHLADDPLVRLDTEVLTDWFQTPGLLADLGCGTGRLSVQFAWLGFQVVAVDLSRPKLQVLKGQAKAEALPILPVQTNCCTLEGLPDNQFDEAILMYGTLGMIVGHSARQQALSAAGRILKPGGRLALHVHNFWLSLGVSQGRRWLVGQGARWLLGREIGDRRMTYRGIPGLPTHLFRWSELRRMLRKAGFSIVDVVPLNPITARPIRHKRWLPNFRAGGWIVLVRRDG